jgi:hypothetical protein
MVIGSRYVPGGTTPGWPIYRKLMSRFAGLLAYPLTGVHDSMCGFFAIRRERLLELAPHATGFKIAFETIVRGGRSLRVIEIPIAFRDRARGTSKMRLSVALVFALRWLAALAREYPRDRGVVVAMLMNLVHLAPGESMFLAAGVPHVYLSGTAVEILASSDNVLRCGLTTKHVDVPELMRVLRVEQTPAAVRLPEPVEPGVEKYPSGIADFALERGGERGQATLGRGIATQETKRRWHANNLPGLGRSGQRRLLLPRRPKNRVRRWRRSHVDVTPIRRSVRPTSGLSSAVSDPP